MSSREFGSTPQALRGADEERAKIGAVRLHIV